MKRALRRAGKKAEDDAAVQIAAKQDAFDQLNTLYAEQVCTFVSECHLKTALVQCLIVPKKNLIFIRL